MLSLTLHATLSEYVCPRCRSTSVGTENPEIKVDLIHRDDDGLYSTTFSNKKKNYVTT